MKYFREVWNEERRDFDRFEVDRTVASRLLDGNYKDVELCLNTAGYYRLFAGGIEVASEGTNSDSLKEALESATTEDIFRELIPLLYKRGCEVTVNSIWEESNPVRYDTRAFLEVNSTEDFERAIKGIAKKLNSIDIWVDEEH